MSEEAESGIKSYSTDFFTFEQSILPYLNCLGDGKIHFDNSVSFNMISGGIVVPAISKNDGCRVILSVDGCSREVRDKLAELCDK